MTLLRPLAFGLALVAALGAYVWITGHRIDVAEARATAAETSVADLRGELAAAEASERVVTRYVDRVQIVRARGATITQQVPVYVTAQADAACTLPRGFVRLHDAAATSLALPDTPRAADAARSGIALSAASRTIVDNYTTCHTTAEQLTALQDWVRVHSAQTTAPPH